MNKPSDATKIVLKRSKKYLFIRFLCSLIYRAIAMITPILFSTAVNEVTNGKYNNALLISIGAIFTVILFRIFDIFNTYTWHKLYNSMYDTYTKIGINKVFDNSLYSLSRFNIGEFLNIMSTDINVMSDFYCNLIMRLIRIFEVLIIFVYFFMIDLYIGLAGVFMALIAISVIFLSSKKIEKLNKTKSVNLDNRNTIINEFLLSIREIKAFNIFAPMRKRIDESTQIYSKSYLKQRVGEDTFKFSVLAMIEAFRWLMFIYGIYLITQGKMEIGTLLIIYNYYTQLVDGFSEFATINTGIRQLKVSENRFYQLIIYSREKLMREQKYKLENLNIKFNEVVYGDKQNPRLKGVTFELKDNSINVITGMVGSGKSGVMDLLLKLNTQHSGTITIGDISITDIDFDYYYNLVSCIDKSDRFLNMSIKENLNIVNDSFEEVVYICKQLNIHDEILKLKYGYDTILNSNEDTLKTNTKILLNIARILLKNTRIMIFDDILSSLDNESREKVIDILNQIKEEHTIIIIDKNDQTIKMSNHIVLLNEGKVSETGEYQKISKNRIYKKMKKNQ
ncbi:MAG: ABC transporter ATP-binding protein [Firmicutes bacterium]|nr:ABC transporter ATP-binding protein [Bacillota bacterium]